MSRPVERVSDFLHHDFCPWANGYVYWLKQPVGWFVLGGAAALLIGISVAPQALIVCAAMVAVAAIGVVWPWVAMRGISASLSFDRRRATEGSPVRVRIAVANRWPWPLWGLLVERGFFFHASAAHSSPGASLARVAGWSRTVFEWEFCPQRRGRYPLETSRLTTGFPFGLWHASAEIATEEELLVWPRTASLQSIPPILGESLAVAGTHSRYVGDEGDVIGVRPFRAGDSLRHVHWPQTARQDRLIVCERQATARRRVLLILDTGDDSRNGATEASEELIRVAASIGRQFHAHRADTELCLGQQSVIVDPGEPGLKRMMDTLSVWSPDIEPLYDAPQQKRNGRSLMIVLTTPPRVGKWRSILPAQDVQFVVFDARGPATPLGEGMLAQQESALPRRSCLIVDGRDDALASLTRRWEQFCHDGWSQN